MFLGTISAVRQVSLTSAPFATKGMSLRIISRIEKLVGAGLYSVSRVLLLALVLSVRSGLCRGESIACSGKQESVELQPSELLKNDSQ